MPLTPLPPENTKRYQLVYTVGEQEHKMLARADEFHSDAAALATLQAVAAALEPAMSQNTTFNGVLVALKGSNVFNPLAGFTEVVGNVAADIDGVDRAYEVAISGRSGTGRKSRVYVYGYAGNRFENFEQDPLTDASLQGWQSVLNSAVGMFLAIDESKPTWYFRATGNYNSYWERALRI